MLPDFPANVYLVAHSATKVTFSFLREIFNKRKSKPTNKRLRGRQNCGRKIMWL